MFRRTESFGYLVNLLARQFIRSLDRRIETHGLMHGQFPALLMLWERPGLTQAEIARIVAVEQPTMANTLNRMERDGWVERRRDPDDRRRTLIYPTEKALGVKDEVLAMAGEVNEIATRGMTDAEKAAAVALLKRMAENLETGGEAD